jgi:hypothetical protein
MSRVGARAKRRNPVAKAEARLDYVRWLVRYPEQAKKTSGLSRRTLWAMGGKDGR